MKRAFSFLKHLSKGCGLIAAIGLALPTAHGGTVTKENNADDLSLGSSWIGGAAPQAGDIALWNSAVTGANSLLLGADASWQGLSLVNPGGAVTIGGSNTLTLGRSGIDMSSATTDLTISAGLTLLGNSQQSWKVATGRTLNLHTGNFTRTAGAILNIQGGGAVTTTNISNDATGIIGPWATIGTGAATRYATVSSGNIVGYTGTSAATAANVTSTAGTENYELAAVGALGAGASFHTLRYTGTTGTITGAFTANGIMNVGGGTVTLGNTITVGSTNELVLNTADGDIAITFNVANKSGDSSRLIKTGSGALTMSIPNTSPASNTIFSGGTLLHEGTINLTTARSLGDAATATVAMEAGTTLNLNAGGTTFTMGNITGAGTINVALGAGSATTTLSRSSLSGFTGILNIGSGSAGGKFQLNTTTGGTSASAINVAQNGTLYVIGGITVNAALTLSGGDTGESLGQLRMDNNSIYAGNITLAGDISGAGDGFFSGSIITGNIGESGGVRTLSKIHTATLTLSGANTYSGATSILGGTLNLTSNLGNAGRSSDVLGVSSSAASNLLLANGTTLSWSGSSAASTDRLFTINGSVAGHGATISANGTTTAAILTFTNTGSIAYGATDQTRTLTLRGTNTGDNTLAVAILDNGTGLVGLTKLDAGTWVLTGNSSYKGITLLSAGTLSISTSSNLGDATNTLTFDGGTLRVTGTSLANLDSRTVTYGTNKLVALNIADSSHTFTLSQALTQGSGGFTKSGAGRVDLTNAGNSYTGVTDIAGGTLRLRGAGLLSASSALRLSGANAILDLNGTNQTVKGFSGTSSSTAKIVNNSGSGTSTITIGTGAGGGTYAGQILDNDGVSTGGKVAVVHDALNITTQFTPTASNTYSGGTTVKLGTLQGNDLTAYSGATTTAAVNPFGSGKINLAGGTLNLRIGAGDDTTAQTLSLGNDMEVTASSTLNYARQGGNTANKTLALGNLNLGAFTLTTLGANGYAVSFSSVTLTGNGTIGGNSQAPMTLGAIGESGGSYSLTLLKGSSNTPFVLTSASTYTGGTNLAGVTVTLQDKAAFGTGAVSSGGGTTTIQASKALTGSDKIINAFNNTQGTFVIGGTNDIEFAGTFTTLSSRTTNVTNTAKTVFSGTGSSVGIFGVSNGTGSIELATDLILNGSTLINGTGGTINATGGAKLKINTAGGDIGTSGILTINAEITNGTASNIDFWNSGGGTVILRGANTWTGATNIQSATVDVVSINSVVGGTASSSLGAPVTVAAGTIGIGTGATTATLKYSSTGETTDRVINLAGTTGGATIEHAGTGLLKFTSNLTATGAGEKTLTLSGSTAGIGEIAGAIVDNSAVNKTNLNKTGVGTWVLSGINTYTGTTTVTQNMLQVGRAGSGRTGSGAVTIKTGGALSGTGLVHGVSFTAESGSTIYAGDGTAQSDYGTLYFEAKTGPGHFEFKSGSKVILGINPGDFGDSLDFYSFSDGTLIFDGDLTVTAESYLPAEETTFALLSWLGMSTTTFNTRYDAASYNGYLLGNGDDNLGFDLPDIAGSGYGWDISQFTIDGTISTVAIPEPSRALLLFLGLAAFCARRRRQCAPKA